MPKADLVIGIMKRNDGVAATPTTTTTATTTKTITYLIKIKNNLKTFKKSLREISF